MSARHAGFHERVWVRALLAPIRTVLVAAFASLSLLLGAWVAHGITIPLRGVDGIGDLSALIQRDLAHAASLAAAQGVPVGWVSGLANAPYAMLFERSGIHAMGQRFAQGELLSVPDTIVRGFYVRHRREIALAMLVTQLVGVRLALLLLTMPLLGLMYLLGTIDGLCRREVRRVTRSQESASLYHRAKYLQVWVLAMTVFVALIWPLAMDIRYVGMLVAATIGLTSRWQWSLYKKHL